MDSSKIINLVKVEFEHITLEDEIDILQIFSSGKKIRAFFYFMHYELERLDERLSFTNEIPMYPLISKDHTSKSDYILDYNFFIRTIYKLYELLNIYSYKSVLVGKFGTFSSDEKHKSRKYNKMIIGILEGYYNIFYVNGSKTQKAYMRYSVPQVFQNDNGVIEFSGVMLVRSKILEITEDENLIRMIDETSNFTKNKQVAFGTMHKNSGIPSVGQYWKNNEQKKSVFFNVNHLDSV